MEFFWIRILFSVKYFLIIILSIVVIKIEAQKQDSCSCTYSYTTNYPKMAQENKISGTVIIEFDRDSTCILSNPTVIKGIGYGCDEEALRAAKQYVNNFRKCFSKCHWIKCTIEKIKWPVTFQSTEEK